ncbi:DNA glycosylase family protein [Actinokineospora pegani]|uniref:hypothetical protein n=1 Tax=Actinokineospora pegani TaxID=2654637 RepID=UPI0018D4529C|nr:hypothetical protein [Actinokineospora pegani]
MTDHPAWRPSPIEATTWVRAVHTPDGPAGVVVPVAHVPDGDAVVVDVVDPDVVEGDPVLTGPLRAAGPVARVRTVDLWEAVGTAAVRQVIKAAQARKLHRAFCETHGVPVHTTAGTAWAFPRPEVVLALSDEDFAELRMTFFRTALRAAAEALTKSGPEWAELPPDDLVTTLCTISRIGPWTARAAVADHTNRFDLYPYSDLAVRTWAARLAPSVDWPGDEKTFAAKWASMTGNHLSDLTLLTLSWGVRHATGGAV